MSVWEIAMLHSVFIAVHAAAGVVAFAAGAVALRRGALFQLYLWSLVGMALFLVLAIAADWGQLDTASRVLFSAFVALAGVMLWRAVQAARLLPTGGAAPSAAYVNHIGFTLVALFDAFIVIAVLDVGAATWLVVAVGIAVAVAGHFVLKAVRNRLTSTAETRDSAAKQYP
jgi:hypothetical protein